MYLNLGIYARFESHAGRNRLWNFTFSVYSNAPTRSHCDLWNDRIVFHEWSIHQCSHSVHHICEGKYLNNPFDKCMNRPLHHFIERWSYTPDVSLCTIAISTVHKIFFAVLIYMRASSEWVLVRRWRVKEWNKNEFMIGPKSLAESDQTESVFRFICLSVTWPFRMTSMRTSYQWIAMISSGKVHMTRQKSIYGQLLAIRNDTSTHFQKKVATLFWFSYLSIMWSVRKHRWAIAMWERTME